MAYFMRFAMQTDCGVIVVTPFVLRHWLGSFTYHATGDAYFLPVKNIIH